MPLGAYILCTCTLPIVCFYTSCSRTIRLCFGPRVYVWANLFRGDL